MLWGFTFMGPMLVKNPLFFVLYWSACLGLSPCWLSAIALYDMIVMRRRIRDEKRNAFNRAFSDIDKRNRNLGLSFFWRG